MSKKRSRKVHDFAHVCREGMEVSIIYNYFRKESTVLKSLQSLHSQSLTMCTQDQVEIVLVDDGTEADTAREKLPPDVIYLWQRKCLYGIARAKNTGAKVANGKYLVFLDPDILVSRTYVDAVLRGFHRQGDRIVQCGYIWDYHFQGCPDPRTEFGVWEVPHCVTSRFYQVAGGNLAIAKALFQEAGGFDEDLVFGGVEDLAFGYKLSQLRNVGVLFNTEMESWHIPHPPGGAHLEPAKSWQVAKDKYPEFYDDYIVRGLR